jgi:hypothetical protein
MLDTVLGMDTKRNAKHSAAVLECVYGDGLFYSRTEPREILEACLAGLKSYLKKPLPDKEYGRFSWLYDRVAKRLGVPP